VTAGAADWRASRIKRLEVAAIGAAGYPVVALLARTLRWRVEGIAHLRAVERAGRPFILAFWHGRILPATWFWRRRGIVVMTSENFDGEWIARIIERFGYATARGSSSRGGRRALIQMKRDVAAGREAAFTLDGPRGPARHAQPGAVWLASVTGSPILPFHIEAARHWTTRSWDSTQVPKPFSTVAIAIGEPIDVPRDVDQERLESSRVGLEQVLAALERRAFEMLGRASARQR
jgi:lysophospholipid acyltransferase (LPLAT)-like uncharacterized protein